MSNEYKWEVEASTVSGIWKFSPNVKIEALQEIAVEWKRKHHNEYRDLHIRGVGKNGAFGIGFRYEVCPPYLQSIEAQKTFFHRITDQLKRRFGNDFVGWDISYPTYVLAVV